MLGQLWDTEIATPRTKSSVTLRSIVSRLSIMDDGERHAETPAYSAGSKQLPSDVVVVALVASRIRATQ